jgi:hypothetical protein
MPFTTKLDFSNNRQVKQRLETIQVLSGATSFGVTFSALPTGPDLSTSGVTQAIYIIPSTFSGNSGTTNYSWYDSRMTLGESSLSAITPSNSATTQNTGSWYTANTTTIIDGNTVVTTYTGVSFDISVTGMTDLGGGNYSGSLSTNTLNILSANTLDFTGRTIWNDTSGITRTERLIVTNNPQVGYVLKCIDSEGMAEWGVDSSGSTASVWTAGTGSNSAVLSGSNGTASGNYSISYGFESVATGTTSHAGGYQVKAYGDFGAHAEGFDTTAEGPYTHAEGRQTRAIAQGAHAEGSTTYAIGTHSHAEGASTTASGSNSHSEGESTIASGESSHAEGFFTTASGNYSHAEGSVSIASNDASHAEGSGTTASGLYSHAENYNTKALGYASHAEGNNTWASSNYSHAEGENTTASNWGSHAEGYGGHASGSYSHVEGANSQASGTFSHAEGEYTYATGNLSHAEGNQTLASGSISHAEGYLSTASGNQSHAEGGYQAPGLSGGLASGNGSHAEGVVTTASGNFSHAQGAYAKAIGISSHAEGSGTTASGNSSHAEGINTTALGNGSHAGGSGSVASGTTSFVHGTNSIAGGNSSIVLGDNIIATANNTTYVEDLIIDGLVSTDPLATDANGKIVAGVSDARLKQNVKLLTNSLNIINNLRGVSFEFTEASNMGPGTRYGFIAQEVQKVIPDIVRQRAKSDGMLNLNYNEVVPILVEAIKELSNGTTNNTHLETQTILAEDNNIELNYSGTPQTAMGGGITVLHAIGQNIGAELITDENGDWVTNNDFKSKFLSIPLFTPTSTSDNSGNEGNITRDSDYLYLKTADGWKRTNLTNF